MPRARLSPLFPALQRLAIVAVAANAFASPRTIAAQRQEVPLTTTTALAPHNVDVTSVVYAGKRAVRLMVADSVQRRVAALPIDQQQLETFAVVSGTAFGDGDIEVDLAGAPAPGATTGARGFVGIAFRLLSDLATYDAFYLRPANGRADDQVRRNHSVQYISHPAWTWERLRRETPERYESYVDLVPGVWTQVRIEVRGTQARLYVHGQRQPTLLVNDLKTGAEARGAIALWIGPGTVAHFRNLRITSRR